MQKLNIDIRLISVFLDTYLSNSSQLYIDPVCANSILAKAGLLADNKLRPGKPLRDLLRKGLLPHAYQPGGKGTAWIIPHSSNALINARAITSIVSVERKEKVKSQIQVSRTPDNVNKELMKISNYKSAGSIDLDVPDTPGLYCIRIKDITRLPNPFNKYLADRKHNILYIGIASKSLRTRFLGQELRARGHGTFFRNIGALLNKLPPKGSLVHMKNKKNYKFSATDELFIIDWINTNLIVNWVEISVRLEEIEQQLIQYYLPLINTTHNPSSLIELSQLRSKCREIANQS